MKCIMSTSMSVLVNGIPGESFKPERGVRQGYPISLYIFIICVEYLGRNIHFMANVSKSGIGVRVAKNDFMIPYLMFTDDCMIFCRATKTAAGNIKTTLEKYSNVFGHLVYYHKSMVQFSKGIEKKAKAWNC